MIKQDVLNAGYVRLVEYMGGDESVIRNARRCWRSEDKSNEESDRNLIRHLLRNGHMSPFEAVVFTFDVKCPIFVARQWMRHRMCLSGDSVITFVNTNGETNSKLQFTLKDLYDRWENGENCPNSAKEKDIDRVDELIKQGFSIRQSCKMVGIDRNTYKSRKRIGNYGKRCSKSRIRNMNLRVLNEDSNEFEIGHIKDIVFSGYKEVFEVTTKSGHTLKSTLEHKYFTNQGWLTLEQAYKTGAKLAVSGYSHIDTNKPQKKNNAEEDKEEWRPIQNFEGKYDISSHGRVRSWVDTRNNVLAKPILKKLATNSANRVVVKLWNNGEGTTHQVSRLVALHFIPNPNNEPYVCHKDDNPSNNHVNNLYWGNEKSNKRDMARNRGMNSSYLEFSEITSLESKGIEATYDISVDHKFHNFTANGFVVHNSSFNEESLRYCVAEGEVYVPDFEDEFNRQFWERINYRQFEEYEMLIARGMPKEQARSILPLGTYTKFYWTVNGSSLMNFLRLRLDESAQAEIREYAKVILDMAKVVAPVSFTEFVPLVLED